MNKKFFTLLTTAALLLTNAMPFAATENSDEIDFFHPSDSVLTSSVVISEGDTSTYALGNNEDLTVNVSLNNNTLDHEISSFEITDVNGVENESVIEQDGKSVTVSGLAKNELYVFESVLISENESSSVRGGIEIVEDEQGELVAVTDVYDFSDLEMVAAYDAAGIMPTSSGSVTIYHEGLDTGSTPINIYTYGIMRGIVHSQYDYDNYKFTVVNSGILDVKLLVPENSGINLSMTVYKINSSGSDTFIGNSLNTGTADEFLRIANATVGDVYRVRIDAVSGSSGNYYLQVENNPAKAWFPQSYAKIGSTFYWNTNNLDVMKYYDVDKKTERTFTDNYPEGSDGMASGCSMSSFAMILANMGAKTVSTKYDFRLSNYSQEDQMQYLIGNLTPDPYIVFLVNNNATGNNISYNNGEYTLSGSYTMNGAWGTIATGFGKTTVRYPADIPEEEDNYLSEEVDDFTSLKTYLDGINSSYFIQGVLMRFTSHTVVVTKESGVYKVYDPGRYNSQYYGMDLEDYMSGEYQSNYSYHNLCFIRTVG